MIKIAKVIGIVKAAKFPDNSPGDNELPTITKTPVIAKMIDVKVTALIFSFKKKYPINIEKKILVSLRAATRGIGAFVKPQTTIT